VIKNILENSIKTALWSLKIDEKKVSKINLEHSEELTHGDYSCNIAMVLAKQVAQNPRELAEKIVAEINENKPKEISKVEVAGPGFINFYLADSFFAEQTKEIIKTDKKFGQTKIFAKQKFLIEHTQPNPFKEFHIGHLMNNAVGESISRIVKANGAETRIVGYHGDVGLHVAKTVFAMQKELPSKKILDTKNIVEKIKYLGKCYSEGDKAYSDDESAKQVIEEINKKVYDKSDKEINKLYVWGRKASLEYLDMLYKRLDSHFDHQFYESEVGEIGKETVLEFLKKGTFEDSEGAVVFKGEKFGLHTRVFINKFGIPTYEAKEIGLAKLKRKYYKYDKSLTVVANEQNSFFDVVEVAIGEVFPELKGKLKHIAHGILKLPSGKMSSRTGTIISMEKLIGDTKEKVLEKIADRDFSDKQKNEVAEIVAIGAIRYSILHQAIGGDIIFDFDKSLSFEGDSGPYLQYSYARAKSILRKAKEEKIKKVDWKKVSEGKEISQLEKLLYRFPEVVERAGGEYSPHYIATYLIELSSAFNNFYGQGKIVDKEDTKSSYKIALTEAFSVVMKNGLNLLGIQAPEKM
jgi:arginyl-tRNA synthetase